MAVADTLRIDENMKYLLVRKHILPAGDSPWPPTDARSSPGAVRLLVGQLQAGKPAPVGHGLADLAFEVTAGPVREPTNSVLDPFALNPRCLRGEEPVQDLAGQVVPFEALESL